MIPDFFQIITLQQASLPNGLILLVVTISLIALLVVIIQFFFTPSNRDMYNPGYKQSVNDRLAAKNSVQWQVADGELLECEVLVADQRYLRKEVKHVPTSGGSRRVEIDTPDWQSGYRVHISYRYFTGGEEFRGFMVEGAPDFQSQAEAENIKSRIQPGRKIKVLYDPEACHYSKINFMDLFDT